MHKSVLLKVFIHHSSVPISGRFSKQQVINM